MITITGRISCPAYDSPLVHPFITRISDNKTFIGDESGRFSVVAQKNDSLRFSYVGTVSRTLPVNGNIMDINLDPYVSGPENLIVNIKSSHPEMETLLKTYIDDKDARIGIGVIINGKDTVEVNGKEEFPMMSVFKFPLALVVAHIIDSKGMDLEDSIKISEENLKENTWSPMVLKYGRKPLVLSVRELLEWSLKESDNNAADILLDYIGGIEGMNFNMRQMNLPKEIKIGATEDDMHRKPSLCYLNMSTPIAMAELLNYFNLKLRDSSDSFREVALMMENCKTGTDRLAAPFISSGAVLGHKTGTGDKQESGRISAINDCGYVSLPDGNFYSIAVFIADSGYDYAATSAMIAEISRIVYQEVCKEK